MEETPAATEVLVPPTPVDRPNKTNYENKLAALNSQLTNLEASFKALTDRTNVVIKKQAEGSGGDLQKNRDALKELKARHTDIKNKRSQLFDIKETLLEGTRKTVDNAKNAKGNLKYKSLPALDAALEELEESLSSGRLSLSEEKAIVKEVEQLRKQRVTLAEANDAIANVESQREYTKLALADVNKKIDELSAELKELTPKMDALFQKISAGSDAQKETREKNNKLFAEKDEIRKKIDEKHAEIRKLKQSNWEQNQKYSEYMEANRKYLAWKEAQDAASAEAVTVSVVSENDGNVYKNHIATCDLLAEYLKKYVPVTDSTSASNAPVAPVASIRNKEADDLQAAFGGSGKSKKDKKKNSESAEAKSNVKIVHDLSAFGQFDLIGVPVPVTSADVNQTLEQIALRKQFFLSAPASQ